MKRRGVKNAQYVTTAILAAAALSALPATTARAITKNYVGPSSGAGATWNVGSNWSPAGLPGSADDVRILHNDPDNVAVTLDVTTTVNTLFIGNAGGGTNTLTQNGAFNLTAGGEWVGLNPGERAVHTQTAGNNTYTTLLRVGNGAGANGTYNLSGGSVFVAGGGPNHAMIVGLFNGTGTFNHTGGTVTLGSPAADTTLAIGDSTSSIGNYTLSNAASSLTVNGPEYIGVQGTGTFTQTAGTHTVGSAASPRDLFVAHAAGSSGTLALSGGAATVNGNAYVGGNASSAGGTGALNITGGTMNATGTLKVWQNGSVLVQAGTLNAGAIAVEGGQLTLGPNVTVASPLSLSAATLYGDVNSRYTGTITAGSIVTLDSGLSTSNELRIGGMANQYTGGFGSFTKVQGAGTVSLPFSNDYAGDWFIRGGTLSIGHASSLGTNSSPLDIRSAALQINNVGLGRAILLRGNGTLRGTGTATIGGSIEVGEFTNSTVTFATGTSVTDVFTVGSSLVHVGEPLVLISGNGTVRLPSSNSSFRANWAVTSGTLRTENSTALGYGSVLVGTGGVFELGSTAIALPLTLNTGSTLRGTGTAASNDVTTIASDAAVTLATGTSASDTLTLNGASTLIGGSASSRITVSGSGKVVLKASCTYTGNWTLASGTLEINADDRLGDVTNILTFDGGTLLTGAAIVSPRSFSVAAGGGTINTNGVNSTYFGAIFGTGGLTKTGAGTLALTGISQTYTGGTTVQAGTLRVNKLHANNAVTINGGTLKVGETSPSLPAHPSGDNAFVSRPSSLTIAHDGAVLGSRQYFGKLDLSNNDLILDYTGASPIANIEDMVRSGYNVTGDWGGTGITSSVAALDGNYVLAVADNALLSAPFGTAQGGPLFAGVDVDLTTILVKFTHRADINLDGLITPDDGAIFGTNYDESITTGFTFAMGDMDFDGACTPTDAAIFGTFYDESLASLPEPASLGAMGLLGMLLMRRSVGAYGNGEQARRLHCSSHQAASRIQLRKSCSRPTRAP